MSQRILFKKFNIAKKFKLDEFIIKYFVIMKRGYFKFHYNTNGENHYILYDFFK